MSNIYMPNSFCLTKAQNLLAYLVAQGATIRLFNNNVTPSDTSVLADFTEVTNAWYAAQALSGGAAASLGGGLGARINWNPVTWTGPASGPGDNIYGYFVTDAAKTQLFWSGAADTVPSPMTSSSNSITIPMVFSDKSIN